MKEKQLWQKLKRNLPLLWMERVENSVAPGMPDVHYQHNDASGWIELKWEKNKPTKIDFEPAQPLWLSKYWEAGGNCFVMLGVESENKIYVWAGCHAMHLDTRAGFNDIEPMITISMSVQGWENLYHFFTSDEIDLRSHGRNFSLKEACLDNLKAQRAAE